MNRLVQEINSGQYKITEETGEVHVTSLERPQPSGHRLFQYVTCPILTEEQIENTVLPQNFDVSLYFEYPAESASLFHRMACGSYNHWLVCERIGRVKIAKNLNMFEDNN